MFSTPINNPPRRVLIVCTSNKDRSPAVERLLRERMPQNEYRSAGINRFFCGKYGTHQITAEDVEWSNVIIACEQAHMDYIKREFPQQKDIRLLALGDFRRDDMISYAQKAVALIKSMFS